MGNLSEIGIDREFVEVENNFTPLPAGEYVVELKNSTLKKTAKGGTLLNLDFKVVEGALADRNIFENLNVVCESAKAQQIARGQLSQLARACGFLNVPDDSSELHDIKLIAKVKIEISKDPQYSDKNKIVEYKMHEDTISKVVAASVAENPSVEEALGDDDIAW